MKISKNILLDTLAQIFKNDLKNEFPIAFWFMQFLVQTLTLYRCSRHEIADIVLQGNKLWVEGRGRSMNTKLCIVCQKFDASCQNK